MMWVLIIVGSLAITGYKAEADCQAAAKVIMPDKARCVPAEKDATVVIAR